MGELKRHLATAADTEAAGALFAGALQVNKKSSPLILLRGGLGAGKTTLVRGLLRGLGHQGPVPSPTYTLVEPYAIGGVRLNHIDLYRLGDTAELEFLGWRELRDDVCLVEWPERAGPLAAGADLDISLARVAEARQLCARGLTAAGRQLLGYVQSHG